LENISRNTLIGAVNDWTGRVNLTWNEIAQKVKIVEKNAFFLFFFLKLFSTSYIL